MVEAKLIAYTMGVDGEKPEEILAHAFSQCYQKKANISVIRKHIKHKSVLEHCYLTFDVECSRVAWEQLVRHRIGVYPDDSFTAQSHRYTEPNASDTCIFIPEEVPEQYIAEWIDDCEKAHETYMKWRSRGISKQTARYHLNNGIAIRATITYNLSSFVNLMGLRLSEHAQEEIKLLVTRMWESCRYVFPNIQGDIYKMAQGEE